MHTQLPAWPKELGFSQLYNCMRAHAQKLTSLSKSVHILTCLHTNDQKYWHSTHIYIFILVPTFILWHMTRGLVPAEKQVSENTIQKTIQNYQIKSLMMTEII